MSDARFSRRHFFFGIASGGQPAAALRLAHAGKENVVALADIDWVRGSDGFERFPKASKYKDFRHVYVEKPLTRTSWEARLLTQAADKYKVATQMGNQGYSHDATRVACEIFWSGEIAEVREVHAWTGRPSWPQGMTKIPPPTPVPETLDWDLWLGGAAWREYTAGDDAYRAFVEERNARGGRGGGRGERAGGPGGATGGP